MAFICGFGHVTVSVLLGLLALMFGAQLFQSLGERMVSLAGLASVSRTQSGVCAALSHIVYTGIIIITTITCTTRHAHRFGRCS